MADLTTWATVQARFGLESSQQTEAERLISLASKRAEQHARRTLAARSRTLLLNGPGRIALDLREWPIQSVTSVHVDQKHQWGSASEVTDYITDSEKGWLLRTAYWPRGFANIRVVAEVGYSEIPVDLEESVVQLVGYWLESPGISWLSPQTGGDAASLQTNYVGSLDLPFQIRNVWDHYKRMET